VRWLARCRRGNAIPRWEIKAENGAESPRIRSFRTHARSATSDRSSKYIPAARFSRARGQSATRQCVIQESQKPRKPVAKAERTHDRYYVPRHVARDERAITPRNRYDTRSFRGILSDPCNNRARRKRLATLLDSDVLAELLRRERKLRPRGSRITRRGNSWPL
jgi:hypothetical protein